MFPGMTYEDYKDKLTDDQIRAIMASTGVSVVEVKREGHFYGKHAPAVRSAR